MVVLRISVAVAILCGLVEVSPAQDQPAPADTVAADRASREEIVVLRAQVQRALNRFVAQYGRAVAGPLLQRYHRIPYQAALDDPALREQVGEELRQLHRDIESPPVQAAGTSPAHGTPERSRNQAPLPGRPYKIAGASFLVAGGLSVAFGLYDSQRAHETFTTVNIYLLASGAAAMVVGALLYHKGIQDDNKALMPGYAVPLVTSNKLGIAFGGTF